MADNSVEERMLDLIEEVCDDEVIREERDIDLFEAGLLDSMAAIELLVGIESEFGVEIAPTAVEREEMNTVNKIIYQVQIRYEGN
ncbi:MULTISPECIES: D-alanine--poly(phosphoribitol) ligase subunit DltC [Adlercreutzia]|uniref:D-alanine--poly(phosphoribitol) ligase subunit DltC n=1 Tax=Adlercreutzia TaxID=447020 RepID=UPI00266D230D|nr:D-alanine--poly(phosphoribitol) ligase subunit DltC [uncultured Adlercreutzia sp.]